MQEKKKLKFLLFLITVLAITGVILRSYDIRFLFYSLYSDYNAVIDLDKTILLKEQYKFFVNKEQKYRMLYRYWNIPVVVNADLEYPYIKLSDVFTDTNFYYVKDYSGRVFTNNKNYIKFIKNYAFKNEVGIINLNFFKKGVYFLETTYFVYPVINYDGKFLHLSLKLADKHIPYKNVKIVIKDKAQKIIKIFPHLQNFSIKKEKDAIKITGKASQDSIVEMEMILKDFSVLGSYRKTEDIIKSVITANTYPVRIQRFSKLFQYLLLFLTIFFPVFFYLFYKKFGREKSFTVPQFISYVPNKNRPPYFVNLIFSNDAYSGDENGFYATLLDLQRKGNIKIDHKYGTIELINTKSSDVFEQKVLYFLREYSKGNVFHPEFVEQDIEKNKLEKDITSLRHIQKKLQFILRYKNPDLSSKFVNRKGKLIFMTISIVVSFLTLATAIFFYFQSKLLFGLIDVYPIVVLEVVLILQFFFVNVLTKTQFFGRWKDSFYKEKLEWDAFKRFLSDFAMIKKYAPKDVAVWKEWLIYATALGVADNVEKAMKTFNIDIPEVKQRSILSKRFRRINNLSKAAILSSTSSHSSGGGGFGVGGGFGGGGAGGR